MSLWNFLVNTLLLFIPLLTLNNWQKDRQRPNTLAAHGLEELFFSVTNHKCKGISQTDTQIQLSGRRLECLGVPWAWIVSAGSSIKLRPEKNVQSSGHWLQCLGGSMSSDCFGGFVAMLFGRFLDQITNYDQKKGTVIWPSVGMSTTYFWLSTP